MVNVNTSNDYGRDLLVILGAGASHDCLAEPLIDGEMPPLTKDLAATSILTTELLSKYREAGPVVDFLQEHLRISQNRGSNADTFNLERSLREYIDHEDSDPNVARHLAAFRFYLRHLITLTSRLALEANGSLTSYTTLVRKCATWAASHSAKICFISFNYDFLLEKACQSYYGFDPSEFTDYVKYDPIAILKPHGSVLWAWTRPNIRMPLQHSDDGKDSFVKMSISAGHQLDAESRLIAGEGPPTYHLAEESQNEYPVGYNYEAVLPAIALPIIGKTSFVWPKEQIDFLQNELPIGAFGKIALVGWRAAENYFTTLIDSKLANDGKLLIVTGGPDPNIALEEADEVENNFKSQLQRLDDRVTTRKYPGGFSKLASSHELDWLLD